MTAGLEVRTAEPDYSMTIGYRRTTIIVQQDADIDQHYVVRFSPDAPEETMVRHFRHGETE
jgi:hypothetical protein